MSGTLGCGQGMGYRLPYLHPPEQGHLLVAGPFALPLKGRAASFPGRWGHTRHHRQRVPQRAVGALSLFCHPADTLSQQSSGSCCLHLLPPPVLVSLSQDRAPPSELMIVRAPSPLPTPPTSRELSHIRSQLVDSR